MKNEKQPVERVLDILEKYYSKGVYTSKTPNGVIMRNTENRKDATIIYIREGNMHLLNFCEKGIVVDCYRIYSDEITQYTETSEIPTGIDKVLKKLEDTCIAESFRAKAVKKIDSLQALVKNSNKTEFTDDEICDALGLKGDMREKFVALGKEWKKGNGIKLSTAVKILK